MTKELTAARHSLVEAVSAQRTLSKLRFRPSKPYSVGTVSIRAYLLWRAAFRPRPAAIHPQSATHIPEPSALAAERPLQDLRPTLCAMHLLRGEMDLKGLISVHCIQPGGSQCLTSCADPNPGLKRDIPNRQENATDRRIAMVHDSDLAPRMPGTPLSAGASVSANACGYRVTIYLQLRSMSIENRLSESCAWAWLPEPQWRCLPCQSVQMRLLHPAIGPYGLLFC